MDRAAIDEFAVPGYTLMERAAAAALDTVRARWPEKKALRIYCGLGNNAGDGYVLARLAHADGLQVSVIACAQPEELTGDAARAAQDCIAAGISPLTFAAEVLPQPTELLVDALFGTGLSRPLAGEFAAAVAQINAAECAVLALDVPSGIDADSGLADGPAVRADCTIGFVGMKSGYFLGIGPDHCGVIEFAGLDIPAEIPARELPVLQRLTLNDIRAVLPRRRRSAHKGDNGRLLVIGGGPGMPGAVRMAGEAALRAGAGLVYLATHPDHAQFAAAQVPELIVHGTGSVESLADKQLEFDAIALGPGLGRSPWAAALCEWAFSQPCPLIADADALNWLAHTGHGPRRSAPLVLTPHPGEAARLLDIATAEVGQDRLAAVTQIAERFSATTVLKGAATLVCTPGAAVGVCLAGNPGMATAGTGDVLTGILGGVLVQCGNAAAAAKAAVLIHALAGDCAAGAGGERGLLATDLLKELRPWVNLS